MDRDELQARVKAFALRVMRLVEALPSTTAGREIGKQLLRSAMSVSANYRATRRARSDKEFAAKIGVVLEEADESLHWLELIMDGQLIKASLVSDLHAEAEELVRIFAASRRSVRERLRPITQSPNHQTNRHSDGDINA